MAWLQKKQNSQTALTSLLDFIKSYLGAKMQEVHAFILNFFKSYLGDKIQ